MKIYFSVEEKNRGGNVEDIQKLVTFLKDNGHEIVRAPFALSEDPDQYLKDNFGIEKNDFISQREIHLKWVDEADLVVADISIPSEGKSMILQHAYDKPKMGLPFTPIILLNKDRENFGRVMKGLIENKNIIYYKYNTIEDVINNWIELIQKTKMVSE